MPELPSFHDRLVHVINRPFAISASQIDYFNFRSSLEPMVLISPNHGQRDDDNARKSSEEFPSSERRSSLHSFRMLTLLFWYFVREVFLPPYSSISQFFGLPHHSKASLLMQAFSRRHQDWVHIPGFHCSSPPHPFEVWDPHPFLAFCSDRVYKHHSN